MTVSITREVRHIALVGIGVACVLALGWVALSGMLAVRHLDDLRTSMRAVEDDLASEQYRQAGEGVAAVGASAAALDSELGGLFWTWLQAAPLVGPSVEAIAVLAHAANTVLEPLDPAAAALLGSDPANLKEAAQLLQSQRSALTEASDAMEQAAPAILALDTERLLSPLRGPVQEVQGNVESAVGALQGVASASVVVPGLFAVGGQTEWVLVTSQPAEARGSGAGYLGAFAVVRARDGRLTMSPSSNNELAGISVDLAGAPEEFVDLWGEQVSHPWAHNLTRHYPYAAELTAATARSLGISAQYVVSLDPHAVAAILTVTGPITWKDLTLDSQSAETYLTSTIYSDFPDESEKDEVLLGFMETLFNALQDDSPSPIALGRALQEPIMGQHLVVWAADPDEQRVIESAAIGGAVPVGDSTLTVAINNTAGGKMDAYLDSTLRYTLSDACTPEQGATARSSAGTRPTTGAVTPAGLAPGEVAEMPRQVVGEVALDLRLDVPAGLPPYVVQRFDAPGPYGSSSVSVYVYGPAGAVLTGFTIDGTPAARVDGMERGHPVWGAYVNLPPTETVEVRATFIQPNGVDVVPQVMAQPLVRPTKIEVLDRRACR